MGEMESESDGEWERWRVSEIEREKGLKLYPPEADLPLWSQFLCGGWVEAGQKSSPKLTGGLDIIIVIYIPAPTIIGYILESKYIL